MEQQIEIGEPHVSEDRNLIMEFVLERTLELLERTPPTLLALLGGISDDWTNSSGNRNRWQPYDVLGHLIHGEKTDWLPRARIILAQSENRSFATFDRTAQFGESKNKTLDELLAEFADLRNYGVDTLRSWDLTTAQLELRGIHPEFGEVSMRQLIATWAVHDLTHIRQIVTEMALRYSEAVGPWKEYLSILK